MTLVRVYRSHRANLEFRVTRATNGTLCCTCKEYRDGQRLLWNLETNELHSTCRHIQQYKLDSSKWAPNPLTSIDWL